MEDAVDRAESNLRPLHHTPHFTVIGNIGFDGQDLRA